MERASEQMHIHRNAVLIVSAIILMIAIILGVFLFNTSFRALHRADLPPHMKGIILSLRIYAERYNGWFPPYDGAKGLNCLIEKRIVVDPSIFSVDKCYPGANVGKNISENNVSFGYFAGCTLNSQKDTIVLIEKQKNWKPEGLVGYLDGRVVELSGDKWRYVWQQYLMRVGESHGSSQEGRTKR